MSKLRSLPLTLFAFVLLLVFSISYADSKSQQMTQQTSQESSQKTTQETKKETKNYSGAFSKVYAFGDSGTDTGNAVSMKEEESSSSTKETTVTHSESSSKQSSSTTSYSDGRMSNGDLVVDYLCKDLDIPPLPPYSDKNSSSSSGGGAASASAKASSSSSSEKASSSNRKSKSASSSSSSTAATASSSENGADATSSGTKSGTDASSSSNKNSASSSKNSKGSTSTGGAGAGASTGGSGGNGGGSATGGGGGGASAGDNGGATGGADASTNVSGGGSISGEASASASRSRDITWGAGGGGDASAGGSIGISASIHFEFGVNFAIAGTFLSKQNLSKAHHLFGEGIPPPFQTEIEWFKQFLASRGCRNAINCKGEVENALFWLGAVGLSDYSRLSGQPAISIKGISQLCIRHIAKLLQVVLDAGAKYIVVQGLPPVGCLPVAIAPCPVFLLDQSGCSRVVNTAIDIHNRLLVKTIHLFRLRYPQSTIVYADYWKAFMEIFNNNQQYKFTEKTKTCCGAAGAGNLNFNPKSFCGFPGSSKCENPQEYINWDGIHFTNAMNKQLAELLFHSNYCDPPFSELVNKRRSAKSQ